MGEENTNKELAKAFAYIAELEGRLNAKPAAPSFTTPPNKVRANLSPDTQSAPKTKALAAKTSVAAVNNTQDSDDADNPKQCDGNEGAPIVVPGGKAAS